MSLNSIQNSIKSVIGHFHLYLQSYQVKFLKVYHQIDWQILIDIVQRAGDAILQVYEGKNIAVEFKSDESPLTLADKKSNDVINKGLKSHFPSIPIISEENHEIRYSDRKNWEVCWIVDPLDGTKEFIKRNGEFTVNIGLAFHSRIVMGIIYVPVSKETYIGRKGEGAWHIDADGIKTKLQVSKPDNGTFIMAASRSHPSEAFDRYKNNRIKNFQDIEFINAGSSLKFCLVASGEAHEYPRLGPTMEWDTAAGQAIVEAAGGQVLAYPSGNPLMYNKEDLHNPNFIVGT